jgi:hypothetical protein
VAVRDPFASVHNGAAIPRFTTLRDFGTFALEGFPADVVRLDNIR